MPIRFQQMLGAISFFLVFTCFAILQGCAVLESGRSEEEIISAELDIVAHQLNSGSPKDALNRIRSLLLKYPENTSVLTMAGMTHLSLKNVAAAEKFLGQTHSIKKDVASGLNFSAALMEGGKYADARKLLLSLAALDPDHLYPYYERIQHNIGLSFEKTKNYKKAEEYYSAALTINPTFFSSHLRLGRVYEITNRESKAEKSYQEAVSYCRLCFEPVQSLSQLLLKRNQKKEALQYVKNFLKLDGVSPGERKEAESLQSLLANSIGIANAL